MITAHGNVESAVRALKLGAFDFVSKPLDLGVLRKLVATAVKLGRRDTPASADETIERAALPAHTPRLMGRSSAMATLRETIPQDPGELRAEEYLARAIDGFLSAVREQPQTWRLSTFHNPTGPSTRRRSPPSR